MPLSFIAEIPSLVSQFAGTMANASLAGQPQLMQAKKDARFPRTARLLRHADFERVYKQGRRHFSANMTVFYLARPEETASQEKPRVGVPVPHNLLAPQGVSVPHELVWSGHSCPRGLRVGFTVGRVLGGAVQRNRMKRRLREAVRMTRLEGIAADVVINPKKTLLAADFTDVVNEVGRAFSVIELKLSQKPSEKALTVTGKRKPEAESHAPEAGSRK